MNIQYIGKVIEHSIRCVDKANLTVHEKRNIIFNLYRFQSSFDAVYVHFEVKNILIKYNYLLSLPIEQNLDYYTDKEHIISEIEKEGFFWLTNDSYAKKDKNGKIIFYFEVGSSTWKKLVSLNFIDGEQAEHVEEEDILYTICGIVALCRKQFNARCAAQWYSLIANYILDKVKSEEDEAKLKEIAYIIFQDAVFNEVSKDINISQNINVLKENKLQPLIVRDWVTPFFKWQDSLMKDPNTIIFQARDLLVNREYNKVMEIAQEGLETFPDSAFLQLYEALSSILILSAQEYPDSKQLHFRIDKLYLLCNTKTENEMDDKTIRDHSFYYIAMAYILLREYDKARGIIKVLKDICKMEIANQLEPWIQSLIDCGIESKLRCQET